MLTGSSVYLTQTLAGTPVYPTITATLQADKYLEFGTVGVSNIYASAVFNNSIVVFSDVDQSVKRITLDGASTITSGLSISPLNSLTDARFVNEGSTLNLYYSHGRSSSSTIYRISSNNGSSWGSTSIVYGGSFIPSFSLAGSTRIYFMEGVSLIDLDDNRHRVVINSVIYDGATWRKQTPYFKAFTTISNVNTQTGYDMMPQITAYSWDQNLDEVFVMGQWGTSGFRNPDEIRKFSSNGRVSFGEDIFIKAEATSTGHDSGNQTNYEMINVTDYVGSTTKVFGVKSVIINNRFFGYSSRQTELGSFWSFAESYDSWGSMQLVIPYFTNLTNDPPSGFKLASLSYGISQYKYVGFENFSGTSLFKLTVTDIGETIYSIGGDVITYTNRDNRDFSLVLGNNS